MDITPTHWVLYFEGTGLPTSMCGPWLHSMCMVHIALQELQAFALMLYRMAFQLSGKVVDNSTAKAYLCNQGGTVSFFPDLPATY